MLDMVIQSLIIAAVVAGAAGYVSGRVMEVKMNGLKEAVKRLEVEVNAIRNRLHEWAPHIGWIDQQRRWGDDDKERSRE